MKNLASLSFLLILFFQITNSYGQETRFCIGLETGPNLVSLYGNEILKEGRQTTIKSYQGLSFQFNINRVFSLRTGLAYEQKGQTKKFQEFSPNGNTMGMATAKLAYSYSTVPILLRATFGEKNRYFLNVGSFAGYALKRTSKIESAQHYQESDDSAYLKKYDLGISIGAGVIFPIDPNFDLSLEVRNNLGIINISDVPVFGDGTIKTNSLNFLLGCSYNFGSNSKSATEIVK